MLNLNDHPALRLHVGDVLLTILREMDSFLPVCLKFILPSSMPFCFRLPPRIADANTSVRPVPDSVIAALGNHGSPARWACSGKPRFSLATLAFNVCELHSLSCPQPQSGAIVTANRGALQARLMSVTGPGCVKTPSVIRFSCALAGGLDGAFCQANVRLGTRLRHPYADKLEVRAGKLKVDQVAPPTPERAFDHPSAPARAARAVVGSIRNLAGGKPPSVAGNRRLITSLLP